tara:strand:+ start:85 stop:627 length:543 start_codon:yes stop_codon:yes gene_type:complete
MEAQDYRATYKKDPCEVNFDVSHLKSGTYLVEGTFSDENWQGITDRMDIEPGGKARARIEVTKTSTELFVEGWVECEMKQVCIRTLKPFIAEYKFTIKERIALQPEYKSEDDQETLVLTHNKFNVGEVIAQHIILHKEPHPIHPDEKDKKRGDVVYGDSMEKQIKEEKNPFSVLKSLKSK